MIDIVAKIKEEKAKGMKIYPVHSNRASSLGHPCARFLVYERTRWNERLLPPVELQFIFDIGNNLEQQAIRDLNASGMQIVEQARPFEWKEYGITGKIDGQIKLDGNLYPIEIKSMSQYSWDKVNTPEDFIYAEKFWLRKYFAQITLYMLMSNSEHGILYCINKQNGQPKAIWIMLDYEFGETLVKQAIKVNQHVADKTLPDRIEYIDDVCGRCDFAHLCLPDIKNAPGLVLIDDEELLNLVKRREEISEFASEYEKIQKKLKKSLNEKEKVLCGDYIITGKWVDKKPFTMPEQHYIQYTYINTNKEKIQKNLQKVGE